MKLGTNNWLVLLLQILVLTFVFFPFITFANHECEISNPQQPSQCLVYREHSGGQGVVNPDGAFGDGSAGQRFRAMVNDITPNTAGPIGNSSGGVEPFGGPGPTIQNQGIVNGDKGFIALAPIPGFTNQDANSPSAIPNLINAAYQLLIAIGAMVAVVKITVAGIKYMGSDAFSTKQEAKHDIWVSLFGLTIIILTVLILQTLWGNVTLSPLQNARSPQAFSGTITGSFTIQQNREVTSEKMSFWINHCKSRGMQAYYTCQLDTDKVRVGCHTSKPADTDKERSVAASVMFREHWSRPGSSDGDILDAFDVNNSRTRCSQFQSYNFIPQSEIQQMCGNTDPEDCDAYNTRVAALKNQCERNADGSRRVDARGKEFKFEAIRKFDQKIPGPGQSCERCEGDSREGVTFENVNGQEFYCSSI